MKICRVSARHGGDISIAEINQLETIRSMRYVERLGGVPRLKCQRIIAV